MMNWEERKREKRLPAPTNESQGEKNHPLHEAAPFYTEDLTSYDYQEAHLASLTTDPRSISSHDNRSGQNQQVKKPPTSKEMQDLKEKCAYLDAELQNNRIKLSLLAKENEKLQEDLNNAQSERKNNIIVLELERLLEENELKNKQSEYLEKTLKLERVKFNQDLHDLRIQLKQLKEIHQKDLITSNNTKEKNEEIQDLLEENKILRQKIINLEREKDENIKTHIEELEEQRIFYEKELEESRKQMSEYFHLQGPIKNDYSVHDSLEDDQKYSPKYNGSDDHIEECYVDNAFDNQCYEEIDDNLEENQYEIEENAENPLKKEQIQQIFNFNQETEEKTNKEIYEIGDYFIGQGNVNDGNYFFENTDPEKDKVSDISEEKIENIPIANHSQGLNTLFDADPPVENEEGYEFVSAPLNNNPISSLFDQNFEPLSQEETNSPQLKTMDWFTQGPEDADPFNQFIPITQNEEFSSNACDFFNSLGDKNTDSKDYHSIPRSLFD